MTATDDHYQLTDRYTKESGHVFLTGIQALARIPLQQLRADRAVGLNTAAFISGYPGSPLGTFDLEMKRAQSLARDLSIVHEPGLNEELGATAVMGSQLAATRPDCRYDGILGLWYGKAPGLDRASDALRHAVFAGTARYGGAVALVGDDPAAKSSTLPSSSDAALVDLHMPIFYPGDVQEALDLGLHAITLSRLTGLWAAMKIVTAVADGNGTIDLSPTRVSPIIPEFLIDGQPYSHQPDGNLLTPHTLEIEREFREVRYGLAQQYVAANQLNKLTSTPADPWLGIVASGFTYHELRQALSRLGLPERHDLESAGIRLLHMQVPVPFDPKTVRRFAQGLDEILVVEEKNPTLEWLIKDTLYGGPDQPLVLGKTHPDGTTLIPGYGILDADTILPGLRTRLEQRLADRLAPPPPTPRALLPLAVNRTPFFCSGCPHNWSTKVPENSLVGAGIGCHGMTLLMSPDRVGEINGLAAMGGEGAPWIGMEPFVERTHFIQNLGDGTYFHSGQLAIQAAVAAGVSITYKLLYNDTVAMTGGQSAPGQLPVAALAKILLAQGVKQVLITTDDLPHYPTEDLPDQVNVWDRTRMVEAQELLATVKGTTVLIHDQACAAQTRRLRKRGQITTPKFRVVINPRLCEGCGDCGDVSNCLSVQPLKTPLGTKTTIDQSSCNYDFSCLKGDCPAFMTVATDGHSPSISFPPPPVDLLPPASPLSDADNFDVRLAGIGGTGVVTVAQMLGTAALLDGYETRGLDQTGLSQKAGPVISDVRFSRQKPRSSNLVGQGGADVVLAFDLLVAGGANVLHAVDKQRTVLVGSTSSTPTGSMVGHPETSLPDQSELIERINARTLANQNRFVDAAEICRQLFNDAASANIFLLGVAVQSGALPLSPDSLSSAIELNAVAVEMNLAAFSWGRAWGQDSEIVIPTLPKMKHGAMPHVSSPDLEKRLDTLPINDEGRDLVKFLAEDLVGYQNDRCAHKFLDLVSLTSTAEQQAVAGSQRLTEAVARGLHKLTAYKDEYEVARLLLCPEGRQVVADVGGSGAAVTWHLHPPVLSGLGAQKKWKLPSTIGRPLMRLLSKSKGLRGTRFDLFGYTEVRRLERTLLAEYQQTIGEMLAGLTEETLENAIEIAELALDVRGYETLKLQRGQACLTALKQARQSFSQ